MLRKTIQATLIVMLMTEGVFAQLPPGVHLKRDKPEPTNLKKEHQKALDHAYRSAVKKIPDWVKVKNPAAPEAKPNPGGSVDPLLAAEAVAFRLALQLEQACLP